MWAFSVHVPPQNDSSANIMLTLSTLNDDGDADLYCLPQKLASEAVNEWLEKSVFSVVAFIICMSIWVHAPDGLWNFSQLVNMEVMQDRLPLIVGDIWLLRLFCF